MKYINKKTCRKNFSNRKKMLAAGLVILTGICGCGGKDYPLAYSPDNAVSSYRMLDIQDEVPAAKPFAADLCVTSGDIPIPELNLETVSGAALFSLADSNIIYAKNVHEQLYPASLTKILTALVAIKKGSLDTVITASENVKITESGAQLCGLKQGDQLTLAQALHLMLINSANDAAIVVAEGIGGSVEGFAQMMNEEAQRLGATNSHFVNPHGLSEDNHYTTVYDMYLILNEAVKHETFNQIIRMEEYTTSCIASDGNSREIAVRTTNLFLRGDFSAPEQITVLGGKTGTTNAAGHCLALVSKDTADRSYISIIMRSDSRDGLYEQMAALLAEIR